MFIPGFKDILEAASTGESTDWEFKSAKGGFPGSFWETYSAMANTEGGLVVLGVRETDGAISFDGLTGEQIDQYQKQLWNGLNNRHTVSVNLLEIKDVFVHEIENKKILAIRIPRASRTARPVYLGPNPFGHTYRRQYEGDYRCTDDEVRRMLADADPLPADQRVLAGFSTADLDMASLNQYRMRFSAVKPDHPWLALDTEALLEKLGGWRRDRTTGQEGLTVAGLLMFGKDMVIRLPEALPNYFVDYREKLDPDRRWTDRLYPDGMWEANLFQFYQRVWPRLISDLKVPFRLEGGIRKDETPVHVAVREAFVNALVHADYAAPGGIVIERYPDRVVMENPGTLLISMEQVRRGGISECRNKALQQMFMMIGGGERAGSGFDKIQSGWKSQHWRAPHLVNQFRPDRVILQLPMISLIPEETLEVLHRSYGECFRQLSEPEVQALVTASLEGEVTNGRLQELLGMHRAEITKLLQGLCQKGFLVSDNKRRWARYQILTGDPSRADSICESYVLYHVDNTENSLCSATR